MNSFLHIISVYKSDTSWVNKLTAPYIFYYKTNCEHPKNHPYTNINICGAETNILKYIIDFYENLPDICVFTHPYNIKWTHPGNLYDNINNLYMNSETLGDFGPIHKDCPRYQAQDKVYYNLMKESGFYDKNLKAYFGEMPDKYSLGKISTSQFFVRKNTIRRLPKKFYLDLYNWLINNSIPNTLYLRDNPFNEFWTSRYMEWSWHFIFTTPLINC